MNMFLAAFRFFLQPLLLSFVPFPTNVNFVPYFVLCSFAAFYTPLSTPFPLFLSRPFSAPALPDHISGNSGFGPLLLRYTYYRYRGGMGYPEMVCRSCRHSMLEGGSRCASSTGIARCRAQRDLFVSARCSNKKNASNKEMDDFALICCIFLKLED